MTDLARRRPSAITGIVAMLLLSIFRRALGLVSISVLSRLLSPAEVGAYAFSQTTGQTFVGILRLGALQGLHIMIARRMGNEAPAQDLGALIGGGVVLCGAIAAAGTGLMVLLADPIANRVFGEPDLAPYVIVAAVFFAGQFLSQAAYVGFAGLGRFVEYTYVATAVGFATAAVTVLGTVMFGVQGAVWCFAGMTLAGVPIYVVGLMRTLRTTGVRLRFLIQRDHLRQIFAIGLPFYVAGVFMIPAEYWSQGLVSRYRGLEALADLRIILTLMAVVQMIPQAVSGPLISLFSEREGQHAGSGVASAFEHMRWLWIFALGSGAALAAVWPLAVTVLFGDGFPKVAEMGQLAIIAFIPTVAGTSLSAGILVGGRSLPLVIVGAAQAAVMVGLALTLIAPLGVAGFFLAQAGSAAFAVMLWLAILGYQTRQVPLRPWMMPLTLATGALCVVMALDAIIAEPVWVRLVGGIAGVPAYFALIALTVLSAAERRTLNARARQAIRQGLARLATWRGKAGGT